LEKTKGSLGKKGVYVLHLGKSGNRKTSLILECEAFKDSRNNNYVSILTDSSWNNLFSEERVEKLRELIIKLNKKRAEMQKSVYEAVAIVSLVDVKISFFQPEPRPHSHLHSDPVCLKRSHAPLTPAF
jgi:hypothetical protein